MNFTFSRADAASLFLMLWIILGVWSGYSVGISLLIPVIALLLVWWTVHHKGLEKKTSSFPDASPILVGGVFVALIALLSYQGWFDRSADVAPSFAANLIYEKIPSTYLPFFDLPFFYPPGLPSVVSQLSSMGFSTYFWGWVLGALGLTMMVFYSSRWAQILEIPRGRFLIPVFVVGLRFPLMSLLTGEYAVLLGYGVAMSAVWIGRERRVLFVIGAIAATLLHPYAGVLAWISGLVLLTWNVRQAASSLALTLLGASPIILQQLLPLLQESRVTGLDVVPGVLNPMTLMHVLGIVPVFFGLMGILYLAYSKKFTGMPWQLWALIGAGLMGVFAAYVIPTTVFGGKIIFLLGMGVVLFAAKCLSLIKFSISEKKESAIALILILGVLFLSNNMVSLANGSKISLDESTYAIRLAENYDVEGKKVLFLSRGHSKMAQYAKTIPYDALSAHFLTSVTYNVFSNPETTRIQEEARAYKELFASRCAECAEKVVADYIVVNTREFPALSLPILNEENGFVLYSTSN